VKIRVIRGVFSVGLPAKVLISNLRTFFMDEKVQAVKILIADDHMIFRDGLKNVLADELAFQVVGEACDGAEACTLAEKIKPDILLLDFHMPQMSGMSVLRSLAEAHSLVRVILLSEVMEKEEITAAFKLGVRGVVPKESTPDMLFKSIRVVMAGRYWIDSQDMSSLDHLLKHHSSSMDHSKSKKYGLTPREMEVMKTVVSGHSNKDIAVRLSISEQTVKHHITSIFDKLGVYNRLELTLFVFHHGLIAQ
jgi:two-component system, NarL family, nitrate/nitrite response regulator NarL